MPVEALKRKVFSFLHNRERKAMASTNLALIRVRRWPGAPAIGKSPPISTGEFSLRAGRSSTSIPFPTQSV